MVEFHQMKWWMPALLFLFAITPVFAQVVINEVSSVSTPEWVEIYNTGSVSVSLKEYTLDFGTDAQKKFFCDDETIDASGYKLIILSSNWLANTGDIVTLKNGDDIVDSIGYGSGYPLAKPVTATDSITRSPDGSTNWIKTSLQSQQGDTVSFDCPTPSPSPSPTPTPSPSPTSTPLPTPSDYSNLFISEYLPYPESGNEWVEIYNGNDSEVNLNGWFVDDVADSGSAPIDISGTINAKAYKQFYLSDSFFNNGGDDARLLNSSKIQKDKTSFSVSTKAKSWSKDSAGNWCQTASTPNSVNPNCPTPTPTPTPKPSPTPSISPPTLPPLNLRGGTEEGDIKENPSPSPQVLGQSTSQSNILSYVIIGTGVILITVAAGLVIVGRRSGKLIFHEEN